MSKPPKCRICRKRPVWRGGDVKNPGPVCKQCYHKKVWPERNASRQKPPVEPANQPPIEEMLPYPWSLDLNYWLYGYDADD